MRRLLLPLLLLLILATPVFAQVQGRDIWFVTVDPAGACLNQIAMQYNFINGNFWGCKNSVWTQVSGGGGGTVTSVSFPTIPAWLTAAVATPTTTPAISVTATTGQTSHQVIGTCNAATTFGPCTLVAGDLPAGTGTVTSVSFTGGLISVANPTTAADLTVAGTSGGIPYFSSASTWASSGALTANGVVLGGGAGNTPTVTSADSTTTHALFATAGAPAFRALSSGDLPAGTGTVTSVATTGPITGGTITTTGTIACATCVTASSPGAGVAHFAGSTQTVTSSSVVNADIANSTIDLTAKVTGVLPIANGGTGTATPFATNAQTSTYQVLAGDFTSYKTITVASGTFTITLVASGSQPATGQSIHIINYGSGVVTVARSGQNINGGTSSLTLAAGSATAPTGVMVVSDGTNYFAQTFVASSSVTAGSGINVTSGVVSATNLCNSVTASDTITSATYFATNCPIPANTLISKGNALEITFLYRITTTATSTPIMGWQIDLCTVSGCGSGTVTTIGPAATYGTMTISRTNDQGSMRGIYVINGFSTPTSTIDGFMLGVANKSTTSMTVIHNSTAATTFDGTAQQFLSMKETAALVSGESFTLSAMIVRVLK